jgi:N-acetylglucosamine-6-phosphate deacetylase
VAWLERDLDRPILMVTLAPEIEGGIELIRELALTKRVVALGHTAVDFGQVAAAAQAGATLSTHLGNGMPQHTHKLANPIVAQLAEDRLAASFIADGIHLPPPALKAMLRAKGIGRSILVTDAVLAAAAPAGRYRFAGMSIERGADGTVRQADADSLAGSSLCLDAAVRNVVGWGFAGAEQALAMASAHPLAAIGPALSARNITLPESGVGWDEGLRPVTVRIGAIMRRYHLSAAI